MLVFDLEQVIWGKNDTYFIKYYGFKLYDYTEGTKKM